MPLHLIPTPIAENSLHTIPNHVLERIKTIKIWYVEELKTARRFLKAVDRTFPIDDCAFYILNENEKDCLRNAKEILIKNENIGLLSEAGCPAIADPGAELVNIAHENSIQVIPYIGPSSIFLALMASGLNGQQFKFNGYLPIKNPDRTKTLQQLEQESIKQHCTQIFIETPYRNNNLLEDLLKALNNNTKLCIALDITGANEFIQTKTIADWKKNNISLAKLPTVFLMQNN